MTQWWFKKRLKYSDTEMIRIIQDGTRTEETVLNNYLVLDRFIPYCHSSKAIGIINDSSKREDAYYIAFTKFIGKIRGGDFRGESSLTTFFVKIFLDECRDSRRRIATSTYQMNQPGALNMEEEFSDLESTSQNILKDLIHKNDLELVFRELKNISNICFIVISLKLEGYNYNEIADKVKITSATARTKRSTCLRSLIDRLKKVIPSNH